MNILLKVSSYRAGAVPLKRLCLNFKKYNLVNMGLLTEGSPLSWEETKAMAEHVRQHGIEQFINLYSKLQERTGDVLKWGDEVRYCMCL